MIVRLKDGERRDLRAGDALYDVTTCYPLFYSVKQQTYPQPHVGISLVEADDYDGARPVTVLSLPGLSDRGNFLGSARWPGLSGWRPDVMGKRLGVSDEEIAEVVLVWNDVSKETSKLGQDVHFTRSIEWKEQQLYKKVDHTRPILGHPLFVSGTCVGFVEYCYECAGLDLVDDSVLSRATLLTTFQMNAFYTGIYPLRPDLDNDRLLTYPECCAEGQPDPLAKNS